MAEVTITPMDNGPYIVRGEVKLVDAEGKAFEVKDTVALCRCGQSGNKPFCDGAHGRVNFQSQVRAG